MKARTMLLLLVTALLMTIILVAVVIPPAILRVDYKINLDGKTATVSAIPLSMPWVKSQKFNVIFFSADAYKRQYRVDGLIRNNWRGTLSFPILPNGAYQVTCLNEEPNRLSFPDTSITPLVIKNPEPGKTYTTYVVCKDKLPAK